MEPFALGRMLEVLGSPLAQAKALYHVCRKVKIEKRQTPAIHLLASGV